MERKIGETFTHDGVELRVEKEINICHRCYFYVSFHTRCYSHKHIIGKCCSDARTDQQGVIFTEVK